MTQPLTQHELRVRDHVTEHYLATGNESAVAEIAKALDWTEAKVRAHVSTFGFPVAGLEARERRRPAFSKDYPGVPVAPRLVTVYGPTREHLRELLVAARLALELAAETAAGDDG